jgi:quercetin dioxygenase-like cupin family protein
LIWTVTAGRRRESVARVVRLKEARDLGLSGRKSLEIISAAEGAAAVTLRHVEIPVSSPGAENRGPHSHSECEECIHVLSGRGLFCTDESERALQPGDTILVPPGESHVTRNTGDTPLVLLCFFPLGDLDAHD